MPTAITTSRAGGDLRKLYRKAAEGLSPVSGGHVGGGLRGEQGVAVPCLGSEFAAQPGPLAQDKEAPTLR